MDNQTELDIVSTSESSSIDSGQLRDLSQSAHSTSAAAAAAAADSCIQQAACAMTVPTDWDRDDEEAKISKVLILLFFPSLEPHYMKFDAVIEIV